MTIRLAIGIGFQRGIAHETLETAIKRALAHLGEPPFNVDCLATHEHKADEPALRALAEVRGWPIKAFPSEALSAVKVPNPSDRPALEVGTASVAEAAAMLAAGNPGLLVEKQRHRGADGKSATVAIARLATEP